jgi:hypothetical protein
MGVGEGRECRLRMGLLACLDKACSVGYVQYVGAYTRVCMIVLRLKDSSIFWASAEMITCYIRPFVENLDFRCIQTCVVDS